ncbi:hypothetical protein [Sphingomonas sanxanigenens]|uniref:N-acetyltransferase domain-containing protein n=1 Tax=Sphingomonas sanxanigenens DSM 19645 = NX02 TaxID=1123269 RepID=W0A3Q3_9SPHN|nr:hypothetical protein [Sphingomonas sanxanigenens]AHE52569.1 hypothetical protein NX02_04095 [Sphingomonas sanxanigenens DSM 19645 = NX02]
MAEVRIVPARPRHVRRIAQAMRDADRRECAAIGLDPRAALRRGLAGSALCRTALVDGEPEAMFGLVVRSAVAGEGMPWLLGTDRVMAQGRALLALGPGAIAEMQAVTPRLANRVAVENGRAIRLLRRWGFVVEDTAREVGGVMFLPFGMGSI